MGVLPGKLLLLSPVDGFPGRVEGLNLLLILWKDSNPFLQKVSSFRGCAFFENTYSKPV